MRTTSSLEALHSVLNRMITKRANIFILIEGLKLHESSKADDMHNAIHDEQPARQFEPRHQVDRDRDQKIKLNSALLNQGKLSPVQFLVAMAREVVCKF